jgi:hypothetical protein
MKKIASWGASDRCPLRTTSPASNEIPTLHGPFWNDPRLQQTCGGNIYVSPRQGRFGISLLSIPDQECNTPNCSAAITHPHEFSQTQFHPLKTVSRDVEHCFRGMERPSYQGQISRSVAYDVVSCSGLLFLSCQQNRHDPSSPPENASWRAMALIVRYGNPKAYFDRALTGGEEIFQQRLEFLLINAIPPSLDNLVRRRHDSI